MKMLLRFVLPALVLACAILLPAVRCDAQTFTPRTITFDGAPQSTPAELLALSGLTPGKPITEADIDAALHRLDDSGLFSNITYKASGTALVITLEPMAASKSRPIEYSNFVTDTPADLTAKLHTRLPLFTGTIPISGDLEAQIERALEAILKDEGIVATVTSIGSGGGVNYSIASPPVVIGSVDIGGVDFGKDPSLGAIRGRFIGQDYTDQFSGEALRKNLLDGYQDLGYQDFAIGPVTHGAPTVTPARITVPLAGTAQPGAYYTVSTLNLPAPTAGVKASEIESAAQLRPGGPAARILVLATKGHLDGAFDAHGYLDAKTAVLPAKDSAAHTVSYTFTTDSGIRYSFRRLTSHRLTAEQLATLSKALTLAPGDPMDNGPVSLLVRSSLAKSTCGGRPMEFTLQPDPASHAADVMLMCVGN